MATMLVQHGILFIVLGTLAGLPYLRAIQRVRDNREQWRILHLAAVVTGGVMIALGLIYDRFTLGDDANYALGVTLLGSNWLFMLGMLTSAISGERGLTRQTKSHIGLTIFVVYTLATVASTAAAIGLAVVALQM